MLWGDARFSFLTPSLVRMELAGRLGTFDDRQSIAVVNRSGFSSPNISVQTEGNLMRVRTSSLTLSYNSPSGNHSSAPSNSSCGIASGADVTGSFSRVPEYPQGAIADNVSVCCALCDGVAACNSWVYCPPGKDCAGADPKGTNCWLLQGVSRLVPSSDRIAALIAPFADIDINVSFSINSEIVTWTPRLSDSGNLKGAWQ